MYLLNRAAKIILSPRTEWAVVATEPAKIGRLYSGYIIPLALIGPVCAVFARTAHAHSIFLGLTSAVILFVLELLGVLAVALVSNALAPSFGAETSLTQAFKWVAYATTPHWVAGITKLIPVLGGIFGLVGSVYGLYLLYLGSIPVMRVPRNNATAYTVGVYICFALAITVIGLAGALLAGAIAASALLWSAAHR